MPNAIDYAASNEIIIWILIALCLLVGIAIIAIFGRAKRLDALQREVSELRVAISGNTQNADLVDRRLIQLLTQTSDDAATLRENLVERVEQVRLLLRRNPDLITSAYSYFLSWWFVVFLFRTVDCQWQVRLALTLSIDRKFHQPCVTTTAVNHIQA